ncbi:MAG: hypothetical protein ABIR96_08785 [Bdellovibrionota bacterium]
MEAFTKEFCDTLLAKSQELEKISSIEFVPVVAKRSDSYFDFRVQLALVAALCAALGDAAYSSRWIEAALVASLAFAAIFALVSIPQILKLVLPAALAREAVIDRADSTFLHEEVFATRARTGVLIFVSLFEKEVFVIGDKGLLPFVKDDYWHTLGRTLAHDFKSKNPGLSFIRALEQLIKDVAPHFPAGADNPNELSDELRRR